MSKYVYEVYNIKKEYELSRKYNKEKSSPNNPFSIYSPNLETGLFEKTGFKTDLIDSKGYYIQLDYDMEENSACYIDGVSKDYGGHLPPWNPGGGAYSSHNYRDVGSISSGGWGGGFQSYKVQYTLVEIVSKYTKTTLKETVTAEEGTYPDDGIQGDYWYVKIKKAIPTIKIGGRTVGAIKYKDSTGKIRNISSIRYKDNSGNIRNLK